MTANARSKDRLYTKTGTEAPWYSGWQLTEVERDRFRQISLSSSLAKARALSGECDLPKHDIPTPKLDPMELMPQEALHSLSALSLFSGGGGLDIGFERAGFDHVASYDILEDTGEVLGLARPNWTVLSGAEGDVTAVDWAKYRGAVDVVHGGPPCQPFSHAGRQMGAADARDMVPQLVRAVQAIRPKAFVCENVAGLASKKFEAYVRETIFAPLAGKYQVAKFTLDAADFGVPQRRRRIFFVGFAEQRAAQEFRPPEPTHAINGPDSVRRTFGAREALGLSDIGYDDLAPTMRSGFTGPRHTTSIVNSATSARHWAALKIWPNGVAKNRQAAALFPAKNGDFRLSVADCLVLQGFPGDWPTGGAVYRALGLIGNSVAPPMGYAVAKAMQEALTR
jgi:DNA (cytosine-5)-methyltransferase 1